MIQMKILTSAFWPPPWWKGPERNGTYLAGEHKECLLDIHVKKKRGHVDSRHPSDQKQLRACLK